MGDMVRGRASHPAVLHGVAILVSVLVCAVDLPTALRAPAALALLTWLPGRALVGAMGDRPVGPVGSRFSLSLALSLALAIVAAVELAAFLRLDRVTWPLTVGAVGLAGCAAWFVRIRAGTSFPRIAVSGLAWALGALSLVIVAAAVVAARTPLRVPDDRGYTVFSTLSIDPATSRAVLEVSSNEAAARTFRIRTSMARNSATGAPFTLSPGQRITKTVSIPPEFVGSVTVTLLNEASAPYRRIRLIYPPQAPWPRASDAQG